MFKGFYTAASGMISQQRKADMLTNNMANANTPGFKADQSSLRAFPEMLLKRLGSTDIPVRGKVRFPAEEAVGEINTSVYMQEMIPNFVQGDLQETGNQTDIALFEESDMETGANGALFFVLETPDRVRRYTKNGSFTLNEQGFLTTNEGLYVLGRNGARIQLQSEDFQVSKEGIILQNGIPTAQIDVAFAANPLQLIKEGSGLYHLEDNEPLPSAVEDNMRTYSVKQGFLEQSNVNVSQTMTDLLTAYRTFEANQKVLQAYDRSMEKAVNEIGRIR